MNDDNITRVSHCGSLWGKWPIFSSWLKCGMRILIEKFVNIMACIGQIMPFRLIVI